MKAGIIVFKGTNCHMDVLKALEYLDFEVELIDAEKKRKLDFDLVVLPGGFSYGDYIASGRLAKFSNIMDSVLSFINKKRGVLLGICNGFQILTEANLLPGSLTYNLSNKFICKNIPLELDLESFGAKIALDFLTTNKLSRRKEKNNFFHQKIAISMPIAHFEGRFWANDKQLKCIEEKNMAFLKYTKNVNGSIESIAGLFDAEKNIIGLMPHPERNVLPYNQNYDGILFFNLIKNLIKFDLKI